MPSRAEIRASVGPIGRGTVIGFLIGIIPGSAHILSSFVSYAVEKKLSNHPEKFGKGAVEGLAGPESANNAAASGAFVPMLALGVPLGPVQAILIAVLIVHGIAPGPLLIAQQPQLFWGFIASMYIGNLVLLILNLPLVGLFVSLLRIPYTYLYPVILACCIVGVYTVNSSMVDVLIMTAAGAAGYALRRLHYDVAPIVLGFILAPMLEMAFRQSLAMSGGDYTIFLQRPITVALLAIGALLLTFGLAARGLAQACPPEGSYRISTQTAKNAGRRCPCEPSSWVCSILSLACDHASAQDKYPSRPITILLGYPPGGSTDTTSRALAPVLERILGQPVVIQNRPGAAALVGTMQVANAAPDGYTITVATTQLSLLPAVDRRIRPAAELHPRPVRSDRLWCRPIRRCYSSMRASPGRISRS